QEPPVGTFLVRPRAAFTNREAVQNKEKGPKARADSSRSVVHDDGRRKGPGPEALEAGVFALRSLEEGARNSFRQEVLKIGAAESIPPACSADRRSRGSGPGFESALPERKLRI